MDDDDDIEAEQDDNRPGRVRIIGAETAAQSAGLPPEGEAETTAGAEVASVEAYEEEYELPSHGYDPETASTELPHWTEAPTGQVPAVLNRDQPAAEGEADPWANVPAPAWREDQQDWTAADEDTFEPSMLAPTEGPLGSLDDSGETDRQPWSFELPGAGADDDFGADDDLGDLGLAPAATDWVDDDTIMVPAVRADEPDPVAGFAAASTDAFSETEPAPARPTSADPIVVGDIDTTAAVAGSTAMPASSPATEEPRRRLSRGATRSSRRRPADEGPAPVEPLTAPVPAPRRPLAPPTPPSARNGRPQGAAQGEGHGRNLPIAIGVGVVLGLIALLAFHLGTVLTAALVTVLAVIGAAEGYAAMRRGGYHPITILGLIATAMLMVATYNKGQAAFPLLTALLFVFSMLWYMIGVEHGDAVRNVAATIFIFVWVGLFASYATLLLNPNLFPDRHGIAFLIAGIACAVAYDIGALAVGGWIGSHPLAPSISPNKTWEGFFGGAVCAVLVGALVGLVHPWTPGKAVVLGLVVAVVSPIGDLTESLFKRGLGLKDMSRILPGHGGLLDRFDGILFVLPATYYVVKAFHLG